MSGRHASLSHSAVGSNSSPSRLSRPSSSIELMIGRDTGFCRATHRRRTRIAMAICCAIGLMIGAFWEPAAHAQTATESAPPSTSAPVTGPMTKDQLEMAARFEQCRGKLQEERTGGLITALRFGASAFEIDVDGARWKPMPFDTQLAIVKTASCYAVAGNPRLHARVQVLDNLDHQTLGNYDGSVLKVP
jgi:hypothetical protein